MGLGEVGYRVRYCEWGMDAARAADTRRGPRTPPGC
ncbi:hypothetical protein FMEAI12_6500085 [Parafrankia sp. Ea1.12]|nr:hypothetical protein FMEAI12_6500085 [Parafrankia sp. Ea1.12]